MSLKEDMAVVGITQLGKEGARLMGQLRRRRVVVTQKNKPVGVLLRYEDYRRMQAVTERLENLVLNHEVKRRASRRKRKTITLEEAERRVGLR